MSWQLPHPAPPDLAAEVACTWTATIAGPHRLVPDGCVDVLWLDDGRVVVCGPETTGWTVALPAGTTAVGVRLRPGAVARVLGIPADAMAEVRIPLADLLGDGPARRIGQAVGEAADPRTALIDHLRPLVHAAPTADPVERGMTTLLTAPLPPAVDEVARATALSSRQLGRRAVRQYGYPPTTLVRLVRFQRLLRRAETTRWRTIADLAHAGGYADHAHLARECRAIAGTTPSALLAEHRPTFPGTSDPFKPPATLRGRVAA